MAKGGTPRNRRRPLRPLLPVDLLLEKHVAANLAVLGAQSAACFTLASGLRHESIHFFFAGDILGRRGHTVEDLDQVEVRPSRALVRVAEEALILDPALRLGEVLLAPFAREIIGVVREMAIIDGDFSHVPIIAVDQRNVLGPRRARLISFCACDLPLLPRKLFASVTGAASPDRRECRRARCRPPHSTVGRLTQDA